MFRSVLRGSCLLILLFAAVICVAQKGVVFSANKGLQPVAIDDYDGDGWHPRSITKSAKVYYNNALNYYNRYLKSNPSDALAFCNRGIAEFRLQKYKQASKDFDAAIKLNPALYQAYSYSGFAKFKLGDHDGALKDCNQALTINPCDTTYRNLGVLRAWMRNFNLAIEAFSKAIDLDSGYIDAYVRRGRVEGQIWKYDAAKSDFAKAIALDSNYAEAYVELPYINEDLNEFAIGVAISNKAIQLDPNNPQAFINRGWEKESLHQSDSAIADFNRAIELAPDFALAYSCRCVSKKSLRDLKGALKDCNKAIQIDSTLHYAYGNRSNVKRGLNDWKGAHQDYVRWLALVPKDSALVEYRDSSDMRTDTMGNNPGGIRFYTRLPYYSAPENVSQFKTDRETESLQGNVKEIVETPQPIDTSEKHVRPYNLKRLLRFNKYGYLTQRTDFNDTLSINWLNDSIDIKFNSRGQKTGFTVYDGKNGAGRYQIIYGYDDQGRMREKTEFDLHLGSRQHWEYNELGDEIASKYIPDSLAKYKWTITYQYNEKGKKTQAICITESRNRTDTSIWEYIYDLKGNTTEEEVYYIAGVRRIIQSTIYNSENRWIQSEYLADLNTCRYDKFGNLTEQGVRLPNGKLKTIWKAIYEYDKMGNWIKQTFFNDNKPEGIVTRVIEYY